MNDIIFINPFFKKNETTGKYEEIGTQERKINFFSDLEITISEKITFNSGMIREKENRITFKIAEDATSDYIYKFKGHKIICSSFKDLYNFLERNASPEGVNGLFETFCNKALSKIK